MAAQLRFRVITSFSNQTNTYTYFPKNNVTGAVFEFLKFSVFFWSRYQNISYKSAFSVYYVGRIVCRLTNKFLGASSETR